MLLRQTPVSGVTDMSRAFGPKAGPVWLTVRGQAQSWGVDGRGGDEGSSRRRTRHLKLGVIIIIIIISVTLIQVRSAALGRGPARSQALLSRARLEGMPPDAAAWTGVVLERAGVPSRSGAGNHRDYSRASGPEGADHVGNDRALTRLDSP